jgi:hypothetical protein
MPDCYYCGHEIDEEDELYIYYALPFHNKYFSIWEKSNGCLK